MVDTNPSQVLQIFRTRVPFLFSVVYFSRGFPSQPKEKLGEKVGTWGTQPKPSQANCAWSKSSRIQRVCSLKHRSMRLRTCSTGNSDWTSSRSFRKPPSGHRDRDPRTFHFGEDLSSPWGPRETKGNPRCSASQVFFSDSGLDKTNETILSVSCFGQAQNLESTLGNQQKQHFLANKHGTQHTPFSLLGTPLLGSMYFGAPQRVHETF